MLAELITYLTTPCPEYVRKMGYLHDAVAIAARHRRCAAAWAEHIARTRAFISKAIKECPGRSKVVVLGSGPLLDLSLDELSASFKEVILVDIVHLPSVLKIIRRFRNVRAISCDITGVARILYENCSRGVMELPVPDAIFPEVDEHTDLVLSLNILSQLPVVPLRYASGIFGRTGAEALSDWETGIIKHHYEKLSSHPRSVCLISDYESTSGDSKGAFTEAHSTIGPLQIPEPDERWIWDIAPAGEIRRGCYEKLSVAAFFKP
jgi:hypothetical protein